LISKPQHKSPITNQHKDKNKMPNMFASHLASLGESLKGAAGNVIDKMDDKIDMPIIIDVVGIKRAGEECYTTARETSGLCKTTIEKAHEMVSFGQELQTTLDDVCQSAASGAGSRNRGSNSFDASKFETIRELVQGSKMQSATLLAKELSTLSLQCVYKSQDMMASMEKGIDALPDIVEPFVENKLKRASKRGQREGDPELPDVEASVNELQALVTDVETVGLFTVVKRGSAAFEGLRRNGELSKDMFLSIQNFAESVESVSGSFRSLGTDNANVKDKLKMVGKVRTVAKDAWRCLRLSNLMKAFAEQVGKLIRWIITLFQMASAKLGAIWGALANAKDAMAGCLFCVQQSIRLCEDSKSKSLLLMETSREIHSHLISILDGGFKFNLKAMDSVRELADGEEILLCIQLGTNIDKMFTECVDQVVTTIDTVDDAIRNMPEVLTNDVPELAAIDDGDADADAGDDDDDDDEVEQRTRSTTRSHTQARSVNIEDDVQQLESMRSGIQEASPLTVLNKSAEGFASVGDTVEKCVDMICTSRGFADTCQASIDSFTSGEWDLQVATGHLLELVAVRDAGLQMRDFVTGVLELVRANVALMEAIRSKSKVGAAGSGGGGSNISSLVGSIASEVDLDDLKGIGQSFQKLGSLFK